MQAQSNNVGVFVDGSGLLAESASISQDINLTPIQVLNRKGAISQNINGGPVSHFNISYLLELNNEPNIIQLSFLKTGWQNINPQIVSIAGITGNCYLESYNFSINPNQSVKSSASYISYNILSGYLQGNKTYTYNLENSTGLAYGQTSFLGINANYNSPPTYSFSYQFSANWQPIYAFSGVYPIQVNLLGGQETFQFEKDFYTGISPSGSNLTGIGNQDTINLYELAFNYAQQIVFPFTINLSGTKCNSFKMDVKSNDIIRVNYQGIRYF